MKPAHRARKDRVQSRDRAAIRSLPPLPTLNNFLRLLEILRSTLNDLKYLIKTQKF